MNRIISGFFLLVGCFLQIWCIWLAGDCLGNETATGLLVLRNGNVLEGRITRLANHFRVDMEHGQIQVRVDQAEMFCLTLDEAYERRREMRIGSTADSHLELAAWCMRHNLYDYTAQELLEARAIDPHHRKLLLLERQLNQVLKYQKKAPPLSKSEKVPSAQPEVDFSSIEQVPQWARAMFVRKVQPMLVKSCATAECHQTESTSELQLNRLAVLGAGHPVATKYNLASVLEQVDFQNALESPLLRLAGTTHGDGKSTSMSPRQLQILQAWVEQLVAPIRQIDDPANVQKASFITVGPSSVAKLSESYKRKQEISELRSKTPQAGRERNDPFDPEVFNRLYPSRTVESQPDGQKKAQANSLPMEQPLSSAQFPSAFPAQAPVQLPVYRSQPGQ